MLPQRGACFPIQLRKSLYLVGQRFPKLTAGSFYSFSATSSGPVSAEVSRDVNLLAMIGLVAIDVTAPGERAYRVTPMGLERAQKLEKQADPDAFQFLRRTVAWVRTRSVEQLLQGPDEPVSPASLPPTNPPLFGAGKPRAHLAPQAPGWLSIPETESRRGRTRIMGGRGSPAASPASDLFEPVHHHVQPAGRRGWIGRFDDQDPTVAREVEVGRVARRGEAEASGGK